MPPSALDGAEEPESSTCANVPDPEEAFTRLELSGCVRTYVDALPPEYRAAVVLKDAEGFKNREIADVLECSLETAKIRVHRGRKMLRENMDAG
jgi:RNA polymerase sigma-70 factor (ECF subfamily)